MRKSIVRDKSRSYELNFLLCSSALPSTGRKIPLSSNYMWPLRDRNISSAPQLLDSQCGVHLSSPFDWPQDSIKLKLHVAAQGPEFSSSAPCPLPYALCPMLYALCPMLYALLLSCLDSRNTESASQNPKTSHQ